MTIREWSARLRAGGEIAAPPLRRRPPLWREVVLGLSLFALYSLVESASGAQREADAERHGMLLLRLERAGHFAVEDAANRWLAGHANLRILANYEYALTYVVTAFWLLAWLYWRRPVTYRWARNSFVLLNLIGISCFALYPTAPPRLLTGEGFVDTVSSDHTWGSWGSPLVTHANQLAAMPSLHVAWALWVTVVLARVSTARSTQAAGALHVLVTVAVIVVTANHFLLDAAGAVLLVALTFGLMSLVRDAPGQEAAPRVAPADAFFLYAESAAWPQHVGGAVVLGESGPAQWFRDRLRARIERTLPELPRFAQQLSSRSRWRRPRWVGVDRLDWDWHVPVHDISGPDGAPAGVDALHRHIARLQSELLPRDRPLWRFVVITGFATDRVAAVLLVHHSVADGIGTVAQAARLLDPVPDLGAAGARPGTLRRGLGIVTGLAQLATDGGARGELPSDGSGQRRFGTLCVPLERLQRIARRYRVRVTDVLLSTATAAVCEVLDGRAAPRRFRVATPLMVRTPDSTAEGNVTAAVIAQVPLGAVNEADRLTRTAQETRRLHTGARALASRFVLSTGIALLPPVLQAAFARGVYGHRFFQAIVSNMPGPSGGFRMAGAPMLEVYPVLPLASRAPLVVGVLTWDDIAHFGVTVEPGLAGHADALVAGIARALDTLDRPDTTQHPETVAGPATPVSPVSPATVATTQALDRPEIPGSPEPLGGPAERGEPAEDSERVSSDPGASVSTTPPRQ